MLNICADDEKYRIRLTDGFDEQSRQFEQDILELPPYSVTFTDASHSERSVLWPRISFWQTSAYIEKQNHSFYLIQVTDKRNKSKHQFIVEIFKSKIPTFNKGIIEKWVPALDSPDTDYKELISAITKLCRKNTKLMSLRLRPYAPGFESLSAVLAQTMSIAFTSQAKAFHNTRFIDLSTPADQYVSQMSSNQRVRLKIREKYKNDVKIEEIHSKAEIPALERSLRESFQRSTNSTAEFQFASFFSNESTIAPNITLLGFYKAENLTDPQAFISGVKHGPVAEFSVGGSLSDPELRKFPFNHVLMWKLIEQQKQLGTSTLDMGGITAGNEDDPMAGISAFKRNFPGYEAPTGKEIRVLLKPHIKLIYNSMHLIKNTLLLFLEF
jgi:hypothetical protein